MEAEREAAERATVVRAAIYAAERAELARELELARRGQANRVRAGDVALLLALLCGHAALAAGLGYLASFGAMAALWGSARALGAR